MDSPLLTGVEGRAGVELLDPDGAPLAGAGIDMRAWLRSGIPLAELDREIWGIEYWELLRDAILESSPTQAEPLG